MWPFSKKYKKTESDQGNVGEIQNQKSLGSFGLLAIASSCCIGPKRLTVRHGIRHPAQNPTDSGWVLSSGHESEADLKNFKLVPLDSMIQDDQSLSPLRDWPVGTEITRMDYDSPWRFIIDDKIIE